LSESVGDKIEFVPSYLDGTMSCHERIYGMKGGRVELVWGNPRRGTSR